MQRYTYYFFSQAQGWTETFYRAAPFSALEEVLHQNYITRRLECMSTSVVMTNIRSSNVDTKRDIIITPLPLPGRGGAWGTPAPAGSSTGGGEQTEPEDSFTALLLRLTDGAANYSSFRMLGIPDHVFSGGGIVESQQATVNSRLNNWMNAITQAGFGMKAQGAPAMAGLINDFAPKTVDNQLVCLGLKGPIPPVGTHVILGSVKPWNKLNKTWRVAATAPASDGSDGFIYLAGSSALNSSGPVEGGKYKVPTYQVAVLQSYTISRLTARKCGVPFVTVHGHR